MYGKINNFNLDINIIIAGYYAESQQCYLGIVAGNGFLIDNTLQGFVTNGSGGDLAKFSLILNNYKQSLPANEVERLVRNAMADAKKSPGVGELDDLFIIPEENDESRSK